MTRSQWSSLDYLRRAGNRIDVSGCPDTRLVMVSEEEIGVAMAETVATMLGRSR